ARLIHPLLKFLPQFRLGLLILRSEEFLPCRILLQVDIPQPFATRRTLLRGQLIPLRGLKKVRYVAHHRPPKKDPLSMGLPAGGLGWLWPPACAASFRPRRSNKKRSMGLSVRPSIFLS